MVILIVAVLVLFGAGRSAERFFSRVSFPTYRPPRIAGVLVTVAGLLFAVWARVHLGKNWSGRPMIKVGHQLIRSGPYQYVRNPIYTGILVGLIGTAMVIGYWIVVFAVGVGFVAFLGKIREEEKLLLETFGEEYVRYRREVKALIPFIV